MLKIMSSFVDADKTPYKVIETTTDKKGKKDEMTSYFDSYDDAEAYVYAMIGGMSCSSCESGTFIRAEALGDNTRVARFFDQNFTVTMKVRRAKEG